MKDGVSGVDSNNASTASTPCNVGYHGISTDPRRRCTEGSLESGPMHMDVHRVAYAQDMSLEYQVQDDLSRRLSRTLP